MDRHRFLVTPQRPPITLLAPSLVVPFATRPTPLARPLLTRIFHEIVSSPTSARTIVMKPSTVRVPSSTILPVTRPLPPRPSPTPIKPST